MGLVVVYGDGREAAVFVLLKRPGRAASAFNDVLYEPHWRLLLQMLDARLVLSNRHDLCVLPGMVHRVYDQWMPRDNTVHITTQVRNFAIFLLSRCQEQRVVLPPHRPLPLLGPHPLTDWFAGCESEVARTGCAPSPP